MGEKKPLKNYSTIITIILCITTVQTTHSILQKFYVSNSPYYTTGYLGAQFDKRHTPLGPNPYAPIETRSSIKHHILPDITHWRKKRIEN